MAIQQNFPAVSPTLCLNFARSRILDSRISFSRPSAATRVNEDGLVEVIAADQPRFNYTYNSSNRTVKSLGLLVEEQRTNLFTYSEQINDASWIKFNVTNVANTTATTAPDGSNNAELITRTTTDAAYFLKSQTKATSSITYTASVFVKRSVGNFCAITAQGTYPSRAAAVFNLNNGTISTTAISYGSFSNASASITPYPNGWYRISLTATSDTATVYDVYLSFNSNGGEIDFVDTASNSAGFVWGAQLEQAPFPTSYIPTVASTVTRSGDLALIRLPSTGWYNYAQGSLVLEHSTVPISPLIFPGYPAIGFAHASGTSQSAIQYFFVKNNGNAQYLVRDEYADQSGINVAGASAAKVGFTYATNSFALARNGAQVGTDSFGVVPQLVGTLVLGNNDNNPALGLNACISNVFYYSRALSSSQLQSLTK